MGIAAGLFIGKPLGIALMCLIAVALGIRRLPRDLSWRHIFGAGLLGGFVPRAAHWRICQRTKHRRALT
ncbi:Na+/H+ antiporter NhaA [Noviherbaspirillum massiliense]|uniref:Na+/H+ antiporter NhaA n=1 Tax=Noviherbaspirillum massiliense TaxID=1465823 RepID=UPI0009DB4899|nr:Na+/H+ antiporter NhaA [Noviherbaspirillum massiliense]